MPASPHLHELHQLVSLFPSRRRRQWHTRLTPRYHSVINPPSTIRRRHISPAHKGRTGSKERTVGAGRVGPDKSMRAARLTFCQHSVIHLSRYPLEPLVSYGAGLQQKPMRYMSIPFQPMQSTQPTKMDPSAQNDKAPMGIVPTKKFIPRIPRQNTARLSSPSPSVKIHFTVSARWGKCGKMVAKQWQNAGKDSLRKFSAYFKTINDAS